MVRLPTQHISIRVPWHDAGWNGTVCADPTANVDCLRLKNINENKVDASEQSVLGKRWDELTDDQLPPCVRERAGFMAPFEVTKIVRHPYTETGGSKAHGHFAPTPLRLPAYAAPSLPFRWMLAGEAQVIAGRHNIDLRMEYEERAEELIKFHTEWLQDKRNHIAMLETFYSAIQPKVSLCFFYAKQVPQIEDHRRILIGIGRVEQVGKAQEYLYNGDGELRALIWERAIHHSIRPGFADGFLLPYHDVFARARDDGAFDPSEFVAFAPEDHWDEFSFASELVSRDGAIAALLAASKVLHKYQGQVAGDWTAALQWVNERLTECWSMRGPCPGLGAALNAVRIPNATLVAYELSHKLEDNEDPWPLVDEIIANPSLLSDDLARHIGPTTQAIWRSLPPGRRALLQLLSRFDLKVEQAERIFLREAREAAGISATDEEILANPYLLYELDRPSADPIRVSLIDRGVFPDSVVREKHPLPDESRIDESLDPRRVRALVVAKLEDAAANGDTLLPALRVAGAVDSMELSPACPLTSDALPIVEPGFGDVVTLAEMADGTRAYQLDRLASTSSIIRTTVDKRLKAKRHSIEADWSEVLRATLAREDTDLDVDAEEARAREEKMIALEELASSRFSVLIGPAGTGKTTMLSALVGHPAIGSGGVLMLAPTGKARVQLERRTGQSAHTIAQFLLRSGRYDPETDTYRIRSSATKHSGAKTVIIDEASMMTEEQLAATIDGLDGVERLILVGDPRQLPPIGPGRPFVDIVARLRDDDAQARFPRVYRGYCELTVRRRQIGDDRDDLLLAEWFSGDKPGAGTDDVWERLVRGDDSPTVRLIGWDDDRDLQDKLLAALVQELKLDGPDDEVGFELTIGGVESKGWVYFNNAYGSKPGSAERAEQWQILSAVRGELHGVDAINRFVQHQFRKRTRESSQPTRGWERKTSLPVGPQQILYGDKVINLRNGLYPVAFSRGSREYVANGEIGIVVGPFKSAKVKKLPRAADVEFSTQIGRSFRYWSWSDDTESKLELAYALTVHKAQGSEFGTTFLVIPSPCRPLTRELIYTALTRQRQRVVLMYQGNVGDLRQYADPIWSETARRMTNVFNAPSPIHIEDRYLEQYLIHLTKRNERVRSKSEVIIANELADRKIDYRYERELVINGSRKLPDFTIEDQDSGRVVYWEHLGLLHDPQYRRKWEAKLAWYRLHKILPLDEGGGDDGALVWTEDDERGGISTPAIVECAQRVSDWLS